MTIKTFLNPDLNLIPVKVSLQGRSGVRFFLFMALDTGAGLTSIPWKTAECIGCDPSRSQRRVEIVTASGVEQVPVVIVPHFLIWGAELKNVEVLCLNLPAQSAISGLLGLNVLKRFDVFLKFRSKTLEVYP